MCVRVAKIFEAAGLEVRRPRRLSFVTQNSTRFGNKRRNKLLYARGVDDGKNFGGLSNSPSCINIYCFVCRCAQHVWVISAEIDGPPKFLVKNIYFLKIQRNKKKNNPHGVDLSLNFSCSYFSSRNFQFC